MKIDTTKQLDSLLKTLRKQGITHYKTPEMELVLGPMPRKASRSILEEIFPEEKIQIPQYNGGELDFEEQVKKAQAAPKTGEIDPPEEVKTPDMLSEEQLLNYSVRDEPGTEDMTD